MRESETESYNAASMTFSAKDGVRRPRLQRGGKSLQSRWSVIRTLPCPTDRRFKKKKKKLFQVVTLTMGKAPNLNLFREREKFLLDPQGLDGLQLKMTHMPKWDMLGRPFLNLFSANTLLNTINYL